MRPFPCPNCRRFLHFEARICPSCGFTLGYDPDGDAFLFLGDNATAWRDGEGAEHDLAVCDNDDYGVCNWLVPRDGGTPYCRACRHNRTIPDLTVPTVPERWGRIEAAKRRLFHTLLRLGLPLDTPAEAAAKGMGQGLIFDFLYDPSAENGDIPQISTGHDGGVITLNLIEADDARREQIRARMGEPYRTLLGHFRHEVGHHYWSRLIEPDQTALEEFRATFGDERTDYASALARHYAGGAVWTDDYVSFYATSHPWEDFAETFAHLLHMVDTLATARGLDARLAPFPGQDGDDGGPVVDFDPYRADVERLAAEMRPFAFALNAFNRSMGQSDAYPFHLSPTIVAKLDHVNRVVQRARS